MSGIEIVLLVAAGIAITHKVKEHKKQKRLQRELQAHGHAEVTTDSSTRSTDQAGSRTRRPNQQTPVEEEETLPLYSPPTKDLLAPSGQEHLPTYDESGSRENPVQQYAPPPEKLSEDSLAHEHESTTSTEDPFADLPVEPQSQPQERPITLSFPAHWYVTQRPASLLEEDGTTMTSTAAATRTTTEADVITPQRSSISVSPSMEKPKSNKAKFWKRHSVAAAMPTAKVSA